VQPGSLQDFVHEDWTVMQMVYRDHPHRGASDILALPHWDPTSLLVGDHQIFGDHPQAKTFRHRLDAPVDIARECATNQILRRKDVDGPPDMFIGAAANPFADLSKLGSRLAKVAAGRNPDQCVFNLDKFKEF
jgi:methylenetetrahydrofolate reductase (NADPH)